MDTGTEATASDTVLVPETNSDVLAEELAVKVDILPGANTTDPNTTDSSNAEETVESSTCVNADSSATNGGNATGVSESNAVSRLSSFWTQWTQPTPNTLEQPVVIQGHEYTVSTEFELKVNAIINLTYRFDFEPIPKHAHGPTPVGFLPNMIFSKGLYHNFSRNVANLISTEAFTNDVGWGCMIRTSQSLLANSLRQFAGESVDENTLLGYFRDNSQAPFSLHNFIQVAGESPLQVKPGEWFGPNAASLSIKRLTNSLRLWGPLPKVDVMISEASDMYDDRVKAAFSKVDVAGLLVLFPVRLGIDKINSVYHSSLLHLLSIPQSAGIAGGKPSSSFYFVGCQGTELIYLDPHYPQSSNTDDINQLNKSYHPRNYQRLDITGLDPSMMIGINLCNWDDYTAFKQSCAENSNKIIYFQENAPPQSVSDPSMPRQRKNSEFVLITSDDYEEDFVTIDNDQSEFIDIKDEVEETEGNERDTEVLVSDAVEEIVMVEEG